MPVGRIARAAAILVSTALAAGCGATDTQSDVEAYERAYSAKYDYETHSVPRGNWNLQARAFGPSEANGKPTILLLHGFPDSLHLYDRLSPLLGSARRTIAFDFLGWGDSDKPADHRYDAASLRADLEAVVAYFKLERVVLVAHDASGFPVIDWALDNPERIAGLVLLNTVYMPSETLRPPESIALFSTPGLKRDISVLASGYFDGMWQSRFMEQVSQFYCDPKVREEHLKILSYQSFAMRPAFFGLNEVLIQEVRSRQGERARMRNFTPPVLIVFGAEDPSLNVGVARDFHAAFPNSELHLLDGACHYVQLDAPDAVAKLILGADMQ